MQECNIIKNTKRAQYMYALLGGVFKCMLLSTSHIVIDLV
jgi:hypothetical protein